MTGEKTLYVQGFVESKLSKQLRESCADENSFPLHRVCGYCFMVFEGGFCLKISTNQCSRKICLSKTAGLTIFFFILGMLLESEGVYLHNTII